MEKVIIYLFINYYTQPLPSARSPAWCCIQHKRCVNLLSVSLTNNRLRYQISDLWMFRPVRSIGTIWFTLTFVTFGIWTSGSTKNFENPSVATITLVAYESQKNDWKLLKCSRPRTTLKYNPKIKLLWKYLNFKVFVCDRRESYRIYSIDFWV